MHRRWAEEPNKRIGRAERGLYHFGEDGDMAEQDLGLLVGSRHRRREHFTKLNRHSNVSIHTGSDGHELRKLHEEQGPRTLSE
jgi:hypothetical protein